MQQAAAATARAEREIPLLNQANSQSAHRRIASHTRADNPPTDHKDIDLRSSQLVEGFLAAMGGRFLITHPQYLISR